MLRMLYVAAVLLCMPLCFCPLGAQEAPTDGLVNIALAGVAGNDGPIQLWGATPGETVTTQLNDGETGWITNAAYLSAGAVPARAYILWPEDYRVSRVVVHHCSYNNDPSQIMKSFEIQTLKAGGDATVDADWVTQGAPVTGNTALVTTHTFAEPVVTRGVRIFSQDERLQVEEMQVFGARADGGPTEALPFAPPVLFLRHHPAAKFVLADVNVRAAATVARGTEAVVHFRTVDGEEALAPLRVERFGAEQESVKFDTATLPPGHYAVTADITIDGIAQAPVSRPLRILPAPEWLGNRIGLTDQVPPPWTPLVVDAESAAISCWGRRYEFDAAVGMSQIEILGVPFLANPTRLIVRRDGQSHVAEKGTFTVTEATEQKVTFTQTCRVAGVEVKAECWMEFDGFLWTRLSLSGPAVDGVTLELPVRPDMARVWCDAQWSPVNTTGLAPTKPTYWEPTTGVAHKVNFMRLGTEERGIQWCRESLRGWHLGDRAKGFGLLPGTDEYVMQFNFINTPTDLAAPVVLEYGWQALPCRERPKGWRQNYWGGMASRKDPPALFDFPEVYMYTERWNGRWNYWNHWSPEVFGDGAPNGDAMENLRRQFAGNWSLRNEVMNLYCNVAFSDGNTPEYRYYQNDWTWEPRKRIDYTQKRERSVYIQAPVCPGSGSYRDFYLYYLDKSLRALTAGPNPPWYGLYFDCSGVWQCDNSAHGCGYRDENGKWQPICPVLAGREYMKRVYIASKAVDPRTFVTIHMSGIPWMAHWAFSDMLIEGEQYAAWWERKLKDDPTLPADYTQFLTPEIMRAQFTGTLWGPQPLFLMEQWIWYSRIKDWGREAHPSFEQSMTHISGMLLVHDALMWGNPVPDPWIQRALRHWGWDDEVEFLPYWNNGKFVAVDTGSPTSVMVSLFRRPAGLMAVVMNDGDQPANVSMTLDFAALGLADAGFFDVVDMGHPPLKRPRLGLGEDGSIKASVPARNYVLLQFLN